jgi:thiosulfate sulfurtransferase
MSVPFVSTPTLATMLGETVPPLVLDVRRAAARNQSGQQIPGALWRDPALWLDWKDEIAARGPVVLYCAHGKEISQALTTALQVMGAQVSCLEGGFAVWTASGGTAGSLAPPS